MNIFPDIVRTNKRRAIQDPTRYICRTCKSKYDAELLGTNICPTCKTPMKHGLNYEPICRNFWTQEEGTFNELIAIKSKK